MDGAFFKYMQTTKSTSKPYWLKLQDPRWQKKRLEIMQRDGFKCQECGTTDEKLHVHHQYYVGRRDPWQYPNSCLQTLCETCHAFKDVQWWNLCKEENLPEGYKDTPPTQEQFEIALDGFKGTKHEWFLIIEVLHCLSVGINNGDTSIQSCLEAIRNEILFYKSKVQGGNNAK